MTSQLLLVVPEIYPTGLDRIATVALAAVLVWISLVDLRSLRLPDAGTLPLIVLGVLLAGWREQGFPWDAALGAASGFAFFALVGAAYFRWRRVDGLGLGDAKLLAAGGAWLGWQALPGLVLMASLIGLGIAILQRNRVDPRLAFGPAIAVAILSHWLVFVTLFF